MWSHIFINLYSGRLRSPSHTIKRLRAVRQPVTCCTPFRFLIGPMSILVEIFLGLASIEDHVWFEDRWMVASWCDE
jgi:hypothetical protein